MDDTGSDGSLTLGVYTQNQRTCLALFDADGKLVSGQMHGDLVVKDARKGFLRVTQTFFVKQSDALKVQNG